MAFQALFLPGSLLENLKFSSYAEEGWSHAHVASDGRAEQYGYLNIISSHLQPESIWIQSLIVSMAKVVRQNC